MGSQEDNNPPFSRQKRTKPFPSPSHATQSNANSTQRPTDGQRELPPSVQELVRNRALQQQTAIPRRKQPPSHSTKPEPSKNHPRRQSPSDETSKPRKVQDARVANPVEQSTKMHTPSESDSAQIAKDISQGCWNHHTTDFKEPECLRDIIDRFPDLNIKIRSSIQRQKNLDAELASLDLELSEKPVQMPKDYLRDLLPPRSSTSVSLVAKEVSELASEAKRLQDSFGPKQRTVASDITELDAWRLKSRDDASTQTSFSPATRDQGVQISGLRLDASPVRTPAAQRTLQPWGRQPVAKRLFLQDGPDPKRRRVDWSAFDNGAIPSGLLFGPSPAMSGRSAQEPISYRTGISHPRGFSLNGPYGYTSSADTVNQQTLRNRQGHTAYTSQFAQSPGASCIDTRFDQEFSRPPEQGQRLQGGGHEEDEAFGASALPYDHEDYSTWSDLAVEDPAIEEEHEDDVQRGSIGSFPQAEEDEAPETTDPASKTLSNTTVRRTKPTSTTGGKKRKGRRTTSPNMTPLQRYIFLPDTDAGGHLEPISKLPHATVSRMEASLETLIQLDFKRACTIMRPLNSKTYVDSQICLGIHMLSRTRSKLAPPTVSCPTCSNFAGVRPCVRLETNPADSDTILVFYPRPPERLSSDAVWTEPRFWLGRGA